MRPVGEVKLTENAAVSAQHGNKNHIEIWAGWPGPPSAWPVEPSTAMSRRVKVSGYAPSWREKLLLRMQKIVPNGIMPTVERDDPMVLLGGSGRRIPYGRRLAEKEPGNFSG